MKNNSAGYLEKTGFKSVIVILAGLFFFPVPVAAGRAGGSEGGYITGFARGTINWSTGLITAKGNASPSKEDKTRPSSSIPGAAKADAIVNLISILKKIRIAEKSVKEFVASNDTVMAQIENTISHVSAVKQRYTSDGALEIKVATSMYGSFLQFILPREIVQIPEIESIDTNSSTQKQRGKYTGFILDARGLKFEPVLYPVIKNEYGDEIYSSVYINRDYAVQYGVCKYFLSLKKALANERIGDNPLIVKGLRTGEDKNSLILNKSDSETIEKIVERHSFFKECRVIIVLDQ